MTREEKKDAIYNLITDYCNDNMISDPTDVVISDCDNLLEEIFYTVFEEE